VEYLRPLLYDHSDSRDIREIIRGEDDKWSEFCRLVANLFLSQTSQNVSSPSAVEQLLEEVQLVQETVMCSMFKKIHE
jgi:hypothetical protein